MDAMVAIMDFTSPMRVVTGGLDGPVLAVLARAERPLTGREVARAAGQSSHSGVRGALQRLADQGIVVAMPAGRAVIYQLNREHLAAPHVLALARVGEELLRRLRERLGAWDPAPVWAVLIGAFPRGEAGPDDRIELMVVRPADVDEHQVTWRAQVDALRRDLAAWTGNPVSVPEYPVEDLERGGAPELVREALMDGIDLVGSPGAY